MAHAVEPLKLKITAIPRQFQHQRRRIGIMGGKLGVQHIARRHHPLGANLIAQVGGGLTGIDRIIEQTHFLGMLNLTVPIGPLDQPNHKFTVQVPAQSNQPVNHIRRPLLIGLDHDAKAVPMRQLPIPGQCREYIQRNIQPRGLLRINGKAKPLRLCRQGKAAHLWVHIRHYRPRLREFIAGMQGRKFHRNTGGFIDIILVVICADLLDRQLIGVKILGRIGQCPCALAQHIKGKPGFRAVFLTAPFRRFLYGAAQNILSAHNAHGLHHGTAD